MTLTVEGCRVQGPALGLRCQGQSRVPPRLQRPECAMATETMAHAARFSVTTSQDVVTPRSCFTIGGPGGRAEP